MCARACSSIYLHTCLSIYVAVRMPVYIQTSLFTCVYVRTYHVYVLCLHVCVQNNQRKSVREKKSIILQLFVLHLDEKSRRIEFHLKSSRFVADSPPSPLPPSGPALPQCGPPSSVISSPTPKNGVHTIQKSPKSLKEPIVFERKGRPRLTSDTRVAHSLLQIYAELPQIGG